MARKPISESLRESMKKRVGAAGYSGGTSVTVASVMSGQNRIMAGVEQALDEVYNDGESVSQWIAAMKADYDKSKYQPYMSESTGLSLPRRDEPLTSDTEDYLNRIESEGQQRPIAKPSSAASTELSDRELLAKTIQAEAGGEGYTGMLAVGAVISNRVNEGGFGKSLQEVILKPGQFSAWNLVTGYAKGKGGMNMDKITPSKDAYAAADAILSGKFESPVGGATHYYNPSIVEPVWGQDAGGNWQKIGGHVFGYANKG